MTVALPSHALGTAATARLLSLAFAPPTGERVDRLRQLAGALGEEAIVAALAEADPADVAGEHERLFGSDGVCPPYEGLYEADPFRETRQLADIAGFYAAFGAEPCGPVHERPDHVGCELEFVGFLALRRAAGLVSDDGVTAAAAEDAFLRDHLLRWLAEFCEEVQAVTDSDFYRAVADAGSRFAQQELTQRGLQVARAERRPSRRVGQDALECGATCGAPAAAELLEIHGRRVG